MIKKKILVLGLNQANFITQLYEALKAANSNIHITCLGMAELTTKNIHQHEKIIDSIIQFKIKKITEYLKTKDIWSLITRSFFWKLLLLKFSINLNFRSNVISELKNTIIRRKFLSKKTYDIYHIHFCVPEYLNLINHIPKQAKTICTFWGSDLLRFSGTENYHMVLNALNKTDIITLQNREMQELLMVKFGRHLAPKIRLALFPLQPQLFNLIDKNIQDTQKINDFKKKIGIGANNTIITIGHNASDQNQHENILISLSKLPLHLKRSFTFLIPYTYGNPNPIEYKKHLEQVYSSFNLKVIFIDSFLTWEELSLLRIITDYMIQAPTSDAMSAAVLETMYSGAEVIAGCWLPYGQFRREGLLFHEISTIKEIPNLFNSIYNPTIDKLRKHKTNKRLIRTNFFNTKTGAIWNSIYQDLSTQ